MPLATPEVGTKAGELINPTERSELCLQCHENGESDQETAGPPISSWRTSTHSHNGIACTDCHRNHYNVPPGTPVVSGEGVEAETSRRPSGPSVELTSYQDSDTLPSLRGTSNHLGAVSPRVCCPCHADMQEFPQIAGPLSGLRRLNTLSLDSAVNSALPEHEDLMEIGSTWTPSSSFLLSASFWIENRHHSSDAVNFDEDNYPIVLTAWYPPTCKWSLSAGYATYTDWIDQDITLGTQADAFTSRWDFGGRANMVNAGANYAWSERLTLTGGVEFVSSRNGFATPPSPNPGVVDYSDLPGLSDVVVETTRFSIGVDYWLRDGITCYFYYNHFQYDDRSGNGNSGTANMFLGGLTATY